MNKVVKPISLQILNLIHMRLIAHIYLTLLISVMLSACDRHDYTTWHCTNVSTKKIAMVLDGPEIHLNNLTLNFCGSLGNQSFFDLFCPANIQESKLLFIHKTGVLVFDHEQYQCTVL